MPATRSRTSSEHAEAVTEELKKSETSESEKQKTEAAPEAKVQTVGQPVSKAHCSPVQLRAKRREQKSGELLKPVVHSLDLEYRYEDSKDKEPAEKEPEEPSNEAEVSEKDEKDDTKENGEKAPAEETEADTTDSDSHKRKPDGGEGDGPADSVVSPEKKAKLDTDVEKAESDAKTEETEQVEAAA